MTRLLHLIVLVFVATAFAPAEALDKPRRIQGKIRLNVVRGTDPFATGDFTASYRLGAVVGGANAGLNVMVTVDKEHTLVLKPGALTRRASVLAYAEAGEKGVVTVGLKLTGDDGGTVCDGKASLALGHGKYDAPFIAGETNCDLVRFVQAFPTRISGTWALAFTATGEAAAKITGGTLWTESVGKDGRPVVSVTPLEGDSFTTEREYFTNVRFDGDPVGASYDVDLEVSEDGKSVERVKTSLDVAQLPGDDGTPGIVFGIATDGGADRYFDLSRKVQLWEVP